MPQIRTHTVAIKFKVRGPDPDHPGRIADAIYRLAFARLVGETVETADGDSYEITAVGFSPAQEGAPSV